MSLHEKPRKKAKLIVPEENAKLKSNAVRIYPNDTKGDKENEKEENNDNDYIDKRDIREKSNKETNAVEPEYGATRCEAYAMWYMTMYPCSEAKMQQKLKEKRFEQEEILNTIKTLKQIGYINDKKLAQSAIEGLARRLWGEKRIRQHLKLKGFREETIAEIDFSEIDFDSLCQKLASKYPASKRNTMIRALINNGFSKDQIDTAIKRCENDDESDKYSEYE